MDRRGAVPQGHCLWTRDTPGLTVGEHGERNMGLKALDTTAPRVSTLQDPREQVIDWW
jgi:hypothetical protein